MRHAIRFVTHLQPRRGRAGARDRARSGNGLSLHQQGNLVAVISNGTAILGLGNRGALAAKPVLEGKAVLFKHFAGIDVFDIEVNAPTMEAFIETVVHIAPTFGGINLEDIAAPGCFAIEEALEARLDIPVFHDDQHGTAVIIGAGLLNALELQGKNFPTPASFASAPAPPALPPCTCWSRSAPPRNISPWSTAAA